MCLKNLISIIILVSFFGTLNCEKTCVIQGFNEPAPTIFSTINAVNAEPIKLESEEDKEIIRKFCPNIKGEKVCCDNDQLKYIISDLSIILEKTKRECRVNILNLLCTIHCEKNQNKYISVVNKVKSIAGPGEFDLKELTVKINTKFVDNFYQNCKDTNFGYFTGDETLSKHYNATNSSELLFKMNSLGQYLIDYHFFNKKLKKNNHFKILNKDNLTLTLEPVVDKLQPLPIVFLFFF